MKLTKYVHACVVIEDGPDSVLIDPGTFTPNAEELIAAATTILVTHDHGDHVAVDLLRAALASRQELAVYAPDAVVDQVRNGAVGTVVAVASGDEFVVGAMPVRVFGELHAMIHPDVPRSTNVCFLVGGRVYHPGDSYEVPDVEVDVLLLATSGPWTSTREAIDFVRAVNPRRCIQIHELMASEIGQRSLAMRIQPGAMTEVALELVPAGATVEL